MKCFWLNFYSPKKLWALKKKLLKKIESKSVYFCGILTASVHQTVDKDFYSLPSKYSFLSFDLKKKSMNINILIDYRFVPLSLPSARNSANIWGEHFTTGYCVMAVIGNFPRTHFSVFVTFIDFLIIEIESLHLQGTAKNVNIVFSCSM